MAGDEEKAEEEKDTELDLIAEQELLRLMRQFRVKRFAKYDLLVNAYFFTFYDSNDCFFSINVPNLTVKLSLIESYLEPARHKLHTG